MVVSRHLMGSAADTIDASRSAPNASPASARARSTSPWRSLVDAKKVEDMLLARGGAREVTSKHSEPHPDETLCTAPRNSINAVTGRYRHRLVSAGTRGRGRRTMARRSLIQIADAARDLFKTIYYCSILSQL